MPRPGRKPVRDARREQILEGLYEAMAAEGTRGTSITDIARQAGIARGALHYYFSSKGEIRLALMSRLGERYIAGLRAHLAAIAEDALPDTKLVALFRYHFGGSPAHAERMLGVWIDFWGHAPSDPALADVVVDVQRKARALCLDAMIHQAPRIARLPRHEQEPLAAAVLALIEGGLLQWRIAASGPTPLDRRALCHALTEAAVAMVDGVDTRDAQLLTLSEATRTDDDRDDDRDDGRAESAWGHATGATPRDPAPLALVDAPATDPRARDGAPLTPNRSDLEPGEPSDA